MCLSIMASLRKLSVTKMQNLWVNFGKSYLQQTSLAPSMAYHPHTDGQFERVNKWVEEYLWHFCHDTQKSLDKWLALAEFCYNSTKHLSIGMSPFEAMYGCKVGMPSLIADMAMKN